MSTASPAATPSIDASIAGKAPLFVGPGIVIEGTIRHEVAEAGERLVIYGKVVGNIISKGILQVEQGATVHALTSIDCEQIILAGTITGETGVTVRSKLLVLQSTGNLAVDTVSLPPGGLEQCRGGILNARLDMSPENGNTVPAEKSAAVSAHPAATVAPKVSLSLMTSRDVVKPSAMTSAFSNGLQEKPGAIKTPLVVASEIAEASRSNSAHLPDVHIPGISKLPGLPLGNLSFSAAKPDDYKAVELPSDSAKSSAPSN